MSFLDALIAWLDEEYERMSTYVNGAGHYAGGVRAGRLQAYAEIASFVRSRSLPRHTPRYNPAVHHGKR